MYINAIGDNLYSATSIPRSRAFDQDHNPNLLGYIYSYMSKLSYVVEIQLFIHSTVLKLLRQKELGALDLKFPKKVSD